MTKTAICDYTGDRSIVNPGQHVEVTRAWTIALNIGNEPRQRAIEMAMTWGPGHDLMVLARDNNFMPLLWLESIR